MSSREEYANTIIAQVLQKLLGIKMQISEHADAIFCDWVIAEHRIVLATKYNDFNAAVQAAQNYRDNKHPPPTIIGAVSYHRDFREDVERAIRRDAVVEFALSGNRHEDWHAIKRIGTVYDLAQSLRRPAAILNPAEDEIEQAVGYIKEALAAFYDRIEKKRGALHKMANILQASFSDDKEEKIYEQSARVAGLILFGALLFQLSLSRTDKRIKPPSREDNIAAIIQQWNDILKMSYAIFGVAKRLLSECEISESRLISLIDAAHRVEKLAGDGVDLMGRIYHQLLADAKPLGAFYTSIPAATLMAGLALHAKEWGDDDNWADLDFIKNFRIADPACGSGTLLAAACWQIRDNFSRADTKINGVTVGDKESTKPLDKLHRHLLENVIWGYDILETAGHLTATTLGLMSPNVDFRKAHIYRTIIGNSGTGVAAGSLELLEGDMPIFIRDQQLETLARPKPLPELDLCIMNPPFVRGTVGNESYSFLSSQEQRLVKLRMNELGKKHGFSNDKGLGSAFVSLACQQNGRAPVVKEGGRIAMILPSTFATGMGNAWRTARQKIEKGFDVEMLIVSRDYRRPNFSENTALQECMVIARRRLAQQTPKNRALFVVLHKNPTTNDESLAVVQAIMRAQKSKNQFGDLQHRGGQLSLTQKIGRFAKLTYRGQSAWRGTSFSDIRLAFVAENFRNTGMLSPYVDGKTTLCPLGDIAEFGGSTLSLKLNHRDFLALEMVSHKTKYAGYYPSHYKQKTGRAHRHISTIAENPNCYVLPLPGKEEWIKKFYAKAGRIIICDSFRFNSTRRLAVLVSAPVQAAHYIPIKLNQENAHKRKAMVLWLNSTPSLLLIAHAAQSTHGAKVGFCQGAVRDLPVLNMEKLTAAQLQQLATAFDNIAAQITRGESELLHLPHMTHDKTRQQIDNAVSQTCGLGDLSPLREALAVEPIITNQPTT